MLQPLTATNDFVVKFANVNGSGSASANRLFAKSILRMGVPVSSRNIFPSNIQGLPTWYEVRVSEAGWRGRRGGVDLMVAMNPQTWDRDVAEIEPGGYLLYDCTRPVLPSKLRGDVNAVGVPLSEICDHAFPEPRQRQLFKNIVYVGVLAGPPRHRAGRSRGADRAAIQGQEPADRAQRAGAAPGLGSRPRAPGRTLPAQGTACGPGGKSHPDRRQRCSGAGLRLRRRDGGGLVPDHAVDVAGGGLRPLLSPIPRRSREREEPVRHRPGRGRARRDRHGDRRRLERRPGLHRDLRAGHLADAGVHRPGLLRGSPGGRLRRPARGPVDRDADPYAAVGHPRLRLREPRRHQARAPFPRGPE